MNETVTLFVEPIDVAKWKTFQQYYEPFTTIVNAGVFLIRNGNAVLHFDSQGTLQTIERGDILYSRRHV